MTVRKMEEWSNKSPSHVLVKCRECVRGRPAQRSPFAGAATGGPGALGAGTCTAGRFCPRVRPTALGGAGLAPRPSLGCPAPHRVSRRLGMGGVHQG